MPKTNFTEPYTKEELAEVKEAFRKLPTYSYTVAVGGWISTKDIPALFTAMGYIRTPEQIEYYVKFWEKHYGVNLTWKDYVDSAKTIHSTALFARYYTWKLVKSGKNSISKDVFRELMKLLEHHDPKLIGIPYETFAAVSASKEDGSVNIPQFLQWIKQYT